MHSASRGQGLIPTNVGGGNRRTSTIGRLTRAALRIIGRGSQNVEQKPEGGIRYIGIQPWGEGHESDSVILHDLDVVQAVHEGAL